MIPVAAKPHGQTAQGHIVEASNLGCVAERRQAHQIDIGQFGAPFLSQVCTRILGSKPATSRHRLPELGSKQLWKRPTEGGFSADFDLLAEICAGRTGTREGSLIPHVPLAVGGTCGKVTAALRCYCFFFSGDVVVLEDSEPDGDVLLELLVPVPDEPQDELPVPDAPELLLPEPESGEDGAFILESLPVPDLVDDPELPEVPLAPEVPEVSLDPDVAGVLLVPELPEVSLLGLALLPDGELVPDAPLLPVSDEPEDEPELPLFGVSVFVVVVVVVADEPDAPDVSDAPDVPDVPDELSLLACAASSLVVVVVVVCPNVCVAIPISDKKIAIGNFFMLAPSNGLNGFFRNCRR